MTPVEIYSPSHSSLLRRPAVTLLLTLVFCGAGVFGLSGCDALGEATGLDTIAIDLGSAGEDLPVSSEFPAAAQTTDVDRGGEDLPSVFNVESITIAQEDVTYETGLVPQNMVSARDQAPADERAHQSASLDAGTIDLFMIIDGAPAIGTRLVIEDNDLTAINEEETTVGNYGGEAFDSCLEKLTPDNRPDLRDNYASLSNNEIQDIVGDAIVQSEFQLSVMVCSEGDFNGSLTIDEIEINLNF